MPGVTWRRAPEAVGHMMQGTRCSGLLDRGYQLPGSHDGGYHIPGVRRWRVPDTGSHMTEGTRGNGTHDGGYEMQRVI